MNTNEYPSQTWPSGPELVQRIVLYGLIFAMSFLIIFSYGLTRPLANSILNEKLGPEGLAYAWLLIAVLVGVVTYVYNRLISVFKYYYVFSAALLFIALSTLLIRVLLPLFPKVMAVIFYAWKDVYILVIVEQLWSFCNTSFSQKSAKKLYGLFMTCGSFGAMAANFLVRCYVKRIGTLNMILWPVPTFILLIVLFILAVKIKLASGLGRIAQQQERAAETYKFSKSGGFKLVWNSTFLLTLLLVVCCMQISTAFLDFQLNSVVNQQIAGQDAKSAFFATVYGNINSFALGFQLLLVPLLLMFYGVMPTHFTIPLVLFGFTLLFTLMPQLLYISMAFIAIKSIDYSVFRAVKELLYMPFNAEVQYKAKAVVDIFGYRFVKVIAAFSIFLLKEMHIQPVFFINLTVLTIMVGWVLLVVLLSLYFKKEQAQAAGHAGPAAAQDDARHDGVQDDARHDGAQDDAHPHAAQDDTYPDTSDSY